MIKVLICDDQEVVRKGLGIILGHADGIEVVGLAENGKTAVVQAQKLQPDVICMDLKMPVLNGIQATKQIVTLLPETRVLVLTTFDADEWVFAAIRAGASGYLLKDSDGEAIVQAVRDTAAGRAHIDPAIAGKVLDAFRQLEQPKPVKRDDPLLEELTPRERLTKRELSILELMANGKTNAEIGETLFLATGTVKNNVSNILGKLQANDRTQAVLAALRQGIVDLE